MRDAVMDAAARVREGAAIGRSLSLSRLFPPMTIHLISSGESSGQLENMLERAAISQERELDGLLAAIMGLLGPGMIVLMGIFVMGIVFAMLLPIFRDEQPHPLGPPPPPATPEPAGIRKCCAARCSCHAICFKFAPSDSCGRSRVSEKPEADEFEDEEDEPVAEDGDVDLDQVNKDLDLAKRRGAKAGDPAWRRLEKLFEEKHTAELTSDFED